jgi:Methyltransferase FkbM domain
MQQTLINSLDANSLRRLFIPEGARTLKRWLLSMLIARQRASLPMLLEYEYKDDPNIVEIIGYLQLHPAEMIPYFFTDHYRNLPLAIEIDSITKLKFVMVGGAKIYYPASFPDQLVVASVQVAMMEQDPRSPHRYLPTKNIDVGGDVAVICGASDCIYTLEIVQNFRHIYIIEADTQWLEPMKQTLRHFLDKITIIPKFVSDQDGPTTITLDTLLRGQDVHYIQADVEGAEGKVLHGAKRVFARSPRLKLSICCYHTATQERELTEILRSWNFEVQKSDGFVLMWMQYPLRKPYLRKAVLYAKRKEDML